MTIKKHASYSLRRACNRILKLKRPRPEHLALVVYILAQVDGFDVDAKTAQIVRKAINVEVKPRSNPALICFSQALEKAADSQEQRGRDEKKE